MPTLCPQEEEERKAREEQAQREHEEYLKLKEAFVVEEEGVGETMTEEQVGFHSCKILPAPTKAGLWQTQGWPLHPRHPAAPRPPPQSGHERWVGMMASRPSP